MSGSFQARHRRNMSSYVGQIGEVQARSFLEDQGFKVESYMWLVDMSDDSGFYRILHDFLGPMTKKFIELNKTLNRICEGTEHKTKIYPDREHKRRRYDFVAKKKGEYYVVEVKTNKAQFRKGQREELQLSKKFGFIPMVIRTKVTLTADSKNVTVELL